MRGQRRVRRVWPLPRQVPPQVSPLQGPWRRVERVEERPGQGLHPVARDGARPEPRPVRPAVRDEELRPRERPAEQVGPRQRPWVRRVEQVLARPRAHRVEQVWVRPRAHLLRLPRRVAPGGAPLHPVERAGRPGWAPRRVRQPLEYLEGPAAAEGFGGRRSSESRMLP